MARRKKAQEEKTEEAMPQHASITEHLIQKDIETFMEFFYAHEQSFLQYGRTLFRNHSWDDQQFFANDMVRIVLWEFIRLEKWDVNASYFRDRMKKRYLDLLEDEEDSVIYHQLYTSWKRRLGAEEEDLDEEDFMAQYGAFTDPNRVRPDYERQAQREIRRDTLYEILRWEKTFLGQKNRLEIFTKRFLEKRSFDEINRELGIDNAKYRAYEVRDYLKAQGARGAYADLQEEFHERVEERAHALQRASEEEDWKEQKEKHPQRFRMLGESSAKIGKTSTSRVVDIERDSYMSHSGE